MQDYSWRKPSSAKKAECTLPLDIGKHQEHVSYNYSANHFHISHSLNASHKLKNETYSRMWGIQNAYL